MQYLVIALMFGFCSINGYAQVKSNDMKNSFKSSGYAPVNGLKIYYEIYGEGEPIVLLHGSYMTIDLNWGELIPKLSQYRKVIALELQGHGRTADTERPFSYEALASDVAGVLEYLKIEQADVLGYSFGGTVALQLAIADPQVVKNLVVISTVYRYDGWLPEVREALRSFKPDFFDLTPLKAAYDDIAPDPEYWHTFVRKLMQFDTKEFNLGKEAIESISSPTLMIMGDNDGVDLEHKMKLYKLLGGDVFGDMAELPASHLAILPAMTHVGLMEQTDQLSTWIRQFSKFTSNPKP